MKAPMTDHLRRLTVFVDEPETGDFFWVLIESTDDAAIWSDVKASEESFPTWIQAWQAGTAELMKSIKDQNTGPRASGEDENADPVG